MIHIPFWDFLFWFDIVICICIAGFDSTIPHIMVFLAEPKRLWRWEARVWPKGNICHSRFLPGHLLGCFWLRRPPAHLSHLRRGPVHWIQRQVHRRQVCLLLLLLLRPQCRFLVFQHHFGLLRGCREMDSRLLGGHGLGCGGAHCVSGWHPRL